MYQGGQGLGTRLQNADTCPFGGEATLSAGCVNTTWLRDEYWLQNELCVALCLIHTMRVGVYSYWLSVGPNLWKKLSFEHYDAKPQNI